MFEVVPFLDRACKHVKESVKGVADQFGSSAETRIAENDGLPEVMQDVAQRVDIAQKHLMQPMQSGNGLRRDSIIVEFSKTNLDGLCVNQSSSKLLFYEL